MATNPFGIEEDEAGPFAGAGGASPFANIGGTSPFANVDGESPFANMGSNPFGQQLKDDSIVSSYDFLKMQLGAGLESFETLYDKWMPDFLGDVGRSLYESGAEGIEDYYPEYPEGLYSASDKLGWVLERTAEGAATNAGLMLASGISESLLAAPTPHLKVAGAVGKTGTFALNWLLQFNENVGVHTKNAGKELSEFTAEERGKLLGASTINALLDQLPRKFALKGVSGKTFDKKSIKEIYERFNSAEKQQFVQSLTLFAKRVLKTGLFEGATEAAQNVVSEASSATGVGGIEGEDLVGAGLVGAMSGQFMGTPGGISEARSANKQIRNDQSALEEFNFNAVQEAGEQFGVGVNNYEKQYQDLVDSYEGPELDIKIKELAPVENIIPELFNFKKTEPGYASQLGTMIADKALNRSTETIERLRANTKTGEDAYRLNRVLRGFGDTETGSGDAQANPAFNTRKNDYLGELLVPFTDIKEKWSNAYPGMGQLFSKVGKDLDKYFGQVIEKKVDPVLKASVAKDLGPKKMAELEKDIKDTQKLQNKVYGLLSKTLGKDGLKINFEPNYLTRGIDRDAVKEDPDSFLKALEEEVKIGPTKETVSKHSTIEAALKAAVKLRETTGILVEGQVGHISVLGKTVKRTTKTGEEVRNEILNDILNDIDPSVQTSEQIRKIKTRTGRGRPSFEKSRDGRWNNLPDKFRRDSAMESINDYLINTSTRLASAEAFGANSANRLNDDINHLLEKGVVGNTEAQYMWDLYDAVHHVYKRPQDKTARTRQATYKTIATVAAVRFLGMATISSITEPAWIIQRAGLVNMLKATPAMAVSALSGIKRSLYAGGVGTASSSSFARDLRRLMGFGIGASSEKVQRLMAGDKNEIVGVYFRTPAGLFLSQYTDFVRSWAGVAGLKMIESYAKKIKTIKGVKKQRLLRELRENGLTLEDFEAVYRAGGNKIDILNDEWLAKMITKSDGTQTNIRSIMVPWLRKITTDVALEPQAANRPLWMSSPELQLLAQLKSFPILFGNTIAKRVIRKMNPKACTPDLMGQMSAVAATGAALGLAALAMAIKDEIRDSDRERGALELVAAIGTPGVGEKSLTGWILGPAGGLADDFLSAAYGEGLGEAIFGKGPEQVYDFLLRATVGAIGAEFLGDD